MNKLVIIGVLILLIAAASLIIVMPHYHGGSTSSSSKPDQSSTVSNGTSQYNVTSIPMYQFVKVSNQDYAPAGKVEVIEQSWVGCPVGATASWAIYGALAHFGKFTYYNHTSDPFDKVASNIPGLIFLNFTPNSTILFKVVYVYNEYLNASATLSNGTYVSGVPILTSQLVYKGEAILNDSLPSDIASLFIKYETEVPVKGYHNASAYIVKPPHLNFGLIVTGPNGTWVMTTPMINPTYLQGMSVQGVWEQLNNGGGNLTEIVNAAIYLERVISMASSSSAPEVSCF
ncbi:DUF929 domain-containing protein [Sulfuracidifex tepidarius]|uniref:DUF929 domain-containing protein n=1 Tax=Sulfuracidifex tepidarius TaxID=1294262 RepID=A0A510E155_9CREN|nr:DUF929 domain-containing protein [Sulfuracidifex tepidarius]BBG25828.1 hypothetical protein IC007_0333 [Sulfuracidifex tepidarius]